MTPNIKTDNKNSIKQTNRKLIRQSTIISLIGIIILGSISWYIISLNTISPEQQRQSSLSRMVKLMAFQHQQDGQLVALPSEIQAGDDIALKLATHTPIHIAVAGIFNHQAPVIMFKNARIPPGPSRLVEKAGSLFTYTIRPTDNTIRLCVIYGDDSVQLMKKIHQIVTTGISLETSACIKIM